METPHRIQLARVARYRAFEGDWRPFAEPAAPFPTKISGAPFLEHRAAQLVWPRQAVRPRPDKAALDGIKTANGRMTASQIQQSHPSAAAAAADTHTHLVQHKLIQVKLAPKLKGR